MRAPLIALLFALATSASAQSLELIGATTYSDWSGQHRTADQQTELKASGLLQTVEIGERGDKPCYLKATFAHVDGRSSPVTRVLDECGSRGPTDRSLRQLGEFKGLEHGINRVELCHGDSEYRMKGLVLRRYAIDFDASGSASPGADYEDLEVIRTNCSLNSAIGWSWEKYGECPSDQFAVGVHLALYNEGIGGIRLICQAVRQASTPTTTAPRPRRIGGATLNTPLPSSGLSYTPTGSFTTRHISGEAGSSLHVITGRPNEVLYGTEFGERSDEPCYLKTYWWDATRGRNDVRTRTQVWDTCNGNAGSKRYVGPSHSQIEGTTGPLRGVDRLVVCTNGRNGNNLKLKGVRLRGSQPNESQNSQHAQDYDFERSNCSDWATTGSGMCTAAQHAVGLEVHHNTVGGRGSMTGITLRCKDIDVED